MRANLQEPSSHARQPGALVREGERAGNQQQSAWLWGRSPEERGGWEAVQNQLRKCAWGWGGWAPWGLGHRRPRAPAAADQEKGLPFTWLLYRLQRTFLNCINVKFTEHKIAALK